KVMAFGASGWQPVSGGLTDAAGVIRARGMWYTPAPPAGATDDPPGPVAVALLPGSHGAMIVPMPETGRPLEIVLPPAATLRGRVTVGGRAGVPVGAIRVLAAYEGKGHGRLAGALSVSATAQADGTFELAGLTPGRYSLQAALDDIWLSPSTVIEVTDRD